MTTDILPFDGGETPEPPDVPKVGDLVCVKDDDRVGDDVGFIMGSVTKFGIASYFVGFRDDDGVLYHVGKYLQEDLEYVGTESEMTE